MNLTCILKKILDKKLHIRIYLQREMQSNLSVFVEFFKNTSIVYYMYLEGLVMRVGDLTDLLNFGFGKFYSTKFFFIFSQFVMLF